MSGYPREANLFHIAPYVDKNECVIGVEMWILAQNKEDFFF